MRDGTEITEQELNKPIEAMFNMKDLKDGNGTYQEKEEKAEQLPTRKHNSPIARIVCWRCRRYGMNKFFRTIFNQAPVTLYRLRYPNGKKSPDYACQDHVGDGLPPIGNQSEVKFQYAANYFVKSPRENLGGVSYSRGRG